MSRLRLSLLGAFEATLDGMRLVGIKTDKARALLIYLVVEQGRAHRRQSLAGLLWPDYPEEEALANLRQVLANLRQILGEEQNDPPFILVDGETIQLNPESDCWLDVKDFERLAAGVAGVDLESAVSLYRGDFLEGFTLKGSPDFDNWTAILRDRYLQGVTKALGYLGELAEQDKDYEKAIGYTRRRLDLEPWQEVAHRQLMRQLALSGQRMAALEQYEACRKSLKGELDVEPSTETIRLYESIRDGEISPAVHTKPKLHNLPVQLTSFIGREHDIAEVKKLLIDYRLVTLTGPGGCGKTRLALQIASDLLSAYEDGVWLAEFAPLSDPALITQVVAAVIGVHEYPGVELSQAVFEYLSSRHILLVFDNCEHLVTDLARFVDILLRKCPKLTVLTTSREGLGVPGEAIWIVPPLSLPIQKPWMDPASAQDTVHIYLKSESVQLFMARVSAISPEYTLTFENAAWTAEICRRLDGMPLAIELAAARVRALSVKQIAERLDDHLKLLITGSRTAPLRQQTLAATLEWSYALLTEPERRVLQRLSIFAGGAALEAAEAVCVCECVKPDEVVDILSRLVDKSLVVADHNSSEVRYRLLETIRQYARHKLAEQGDEDECKDRHLLYFMQWAETLAPMIEGQDQLIGLKRFEVEHDNLRTALEWGRINEKKAKAGLRLAAACGLFWTSHGYLSEGRRHLSAALSPMHVKDRSITHARALMYSAQLAYLQADYPAGQPLVEEALAIWRDLGPDYRAGLARAIKLYGGFRMEVGDYGSAVRLFQESLDISTQLNHKNGIGTAHRDLGWSAMRTGDYPLAQTHLEKNLALAQEIGDKTSLTYAYSGLGEVAVRLGQYESASDLLEKGLSLSRELGDTWLEATILGSLGWVALLLRNFEPMRNFLSESLSLRMGIGDKGGIAWCLEKLAEGAVLEGQYQKAVTIFASAASLRIPIHSVIDPADLPEYERILAGLRSKLTLKIFTACWEEGKVMPLREVIAYALSEPVMPIDGTIISDKYKFQGLSKRERETAALIAQGKSNRAIAQAMTIGEKTVETYVTRILHKLGFDSRVQIATWAVEKGLISLQKE